MNKKRILFVLSLFVFTSIIVGCNRAGTEIDSISNQLDTYVEIDDTDKNLEEISEIVFATNLERLKDINISDTLKINDYKIEKINIEREEETRYMFSVEYSVLPASTDNVLVANGSLEEDGWIRNIYHFIEVEKTDKGYIIVNITTSP